MEPGPGVPRAGNIEQRARHGPACVPGTKTKMGTEQATASKAGEQTDAAVRVKLGGRLEKKQVVGKQEGSTPGRGNRSGF